LAPTKRVGVDSVPFNDFSFFDHMLDMALALGVIPKRFNPQADWLELSFSMARGNPDAYPLAVRKWFNTNYHYLVPRSPRLPL